MQTTKLPTRSQYAGRVITASLIVATAFVMNAMVRRRSSQLKMPRQDAYALLATRLKSAVSQPDLRADSQPPTDALRLTANWPEYADSGRPDYADS